MTTKSKEKPSALDVLCKEFVRDIDSLSVPLPFIMQVLAKTAEAHNKELDKFIDANATDIKNTDEGRQYAINIEHNTAHDKLHRRLSIFIDSLSVTPRSFFVSLVSTYDAYLGRLIKELFNLKPKLLNGAERTLTFAQIKKLGSLEAAQEFIVEKEVETVLRKSHAQQFEWLEKTFSVPLRKGLECWPQFVEVTERRNLFVHADGIVSSQYISVCQEHGYNMNPELIPSSSQLDVDPAYFEASAHCMLEIGIKLTHVLWRKLDPDRRKEADLNLIHIIYDFLIRRSYRLARELSDFAINVIKKYSSDETRRIFVINHVIAYKFSGDSEKASGILSAEDWSSSADRFRLVVAVLRDDFKEACNIMKRIGKTGELGPLEYREWPAFKEFRKSDDFRSLYEEIFGQEFKLQEKEPKAGSHATKQKDMFVNIEITDVPPTSPA